MARWIEVKNWVIDFIKDEDDIHKIINLLKFDDTLSLGIVIGNGLRTHEGLVVKKVFYSNKSWKRFDAYFSNPNLKYSYESALDCVVFGDVDECSPEVLKTREDNFVKMLMEQLENINKYGIALLLNDKPINELLLGEVSPSKTLLETTDVSELKDKIELLSLRIDPYAHFIESLAQMKKAEDKNDSINKEISRLNRYVALIEKDGVNAVDDLWKVS